jgi:hypothetical protein
VAHGRVVHGSHQERDAAALQQPRCVAGRDVERYAERLEHIGAARPAAHGAIAVLGDRHPRRCRDQRGAGRQVERALAVAPGAAGVEHERKAVIDRYHRSSHRLDRCGDDLGVLSAQAQRDGEAGDLHRRPLAGQDRVEHPPDRARGNATRRGELGEDLGETCGLGHSASNQFCTSCMPCSVRIDSG